jgi:hypothetical protein
MERQAVLEQIHLQRSTKEQQKRAALLSDTDGTADTAGIVD